MNGKDVADTIAGAIFVGGLEGVFYSMIPLTFMDGAVVYRWSRLAWVGIFGSATFLFWQLVINQYASYLKAFEQPTVIAILLILAVYGTLRLLPGVTEPGEPPVTKAANTSSPASTAADAPVSTTVP